MIYQPYATKIDDRHICDLINRFMFMSGALTLDDLITVNVCIDAHMTTNDIINRVMAVYGLEG
jgi:hypothetical protein